MRYPGSSPRAETVVTYSVAFPQPSQLGLSFDMGSTRSLSANARLRAAFQGRLPVEGHAGISRVTTGGSRH